MALNVEVQESVRVNSRRGLMLGSRRYWIGGRVFRYHTVVTVEDWVQGGDESKTKQGEGDCRPPQNFLLQPLTATQRTRP